MKDKAIEKINKELKAFKGGRGEAVMKDRCAEILKNFCEQDEEFAQAVVQTDRTLSDCLKAIWNKYGNEARTQGISDLDAFKVMAQFYFPGAGVHCVMTVDVEANEPAETFNTEQHEEATETDEPDQEEIIEEEEPKPVKKSLSFNLDDLLG